MAKGTSACDVYYVNHDKRKEMEAKLKQTGAQKSKELMDMYQKSIDERKSKLRLEAEERKIALEAMLREDD